MVKNGNYKLRASPVVGVGGMYATSNGTFKIVTTAAQVPSTFDRQTVSFCVLVCHLFDHTNLAASLPQWKITAVEHKKDTYTIVLVEQDDISLGGSWALDNINEAVPHGPIITAEEVFEWVITPTNDDLPPNTYKYVVYGCLG